MAAQTNQLEKVETKLNATSRKTETIDSRTLRLLDDVHELKSAVKNLYEILEAQSAEMRELRR